MCAGWMLNKFQGYESQERATEAFPKKKIDGWFPHRLICATTHSQDAKSHLSLQTCLGSPQYTDTLRETIQGIGAIWIHDPGQAVGLPTAQHEVRGTQAKFPVATSFLFSLPSFTFTCVWGTLYCINNQCNWLSSGGKIQ